MFIKPYNDYSEVGYRGPMRLDMNDIPQPEPTRYLSIEEIRILNRLLEHEYIRPEDEEGRIVVAKIKSIVNDLG